MTPVDELPANLDKLRSYIADVDNLPIDKKLRFAIMLKVFVENLSKSCGCGGVKVAAEVPITTNRKSCLLCAEKHIGAAAVKLEETQFGYKYKVMIVGHLNEAEEETVDQYPALANIIRDARVKFQETNTLEIEPLISLLEEVKNDNQRSNA